MEYVYLKKNSMPTKDIYLNRVETLCSGKNFELKLRNPH